MTLELLLKDYGNVRRQVHSIELSPDEGLLALAPWGTVCVFDAHSAQQKWTTSIRSHQVIFSPNGMQLAVADFSGYVRIFASETGDLLRTLSGHESDVCGVAWSSTGIIASASDDETICLWNPSDGTCLRTLSDHAHQACGVSFSPEGRQLASCSYDHTIRVWDVASGTCLHTLYGHTGFIWRVAFSPDGSKLASTSHDGTVRVWDALSNFECIRSLAECGSGSGLVAWSPDSRILATVNTSHLQLWDENGASILEAKNQASAVAFSRLSHDIIIGASDGKVSRWKSPVDWTLESVRLRELTPPSESPCDISGALDRISTIIDRMDPPAEFFNQIKLLREVNPSSFVDMQTRTRVARDLEQGFGKLIDQRQSFKNAQTSLHQKARHRQQLGEAKEDLVKLESSLQLQCISVVNERLKEYNRLQDDPASEETSVKQHDHSPLRDLSEKELEDIFTFAHTSYARLARLAQAVTDAARQFEKALLDYDLFSAEIREQSEKNIDVIAAASLSLRPSTVISSERIVAMERVISESQAMLDNDRDSMSKLDRSLAELSSANEQLRKMLEEQKSRKEQAEIQAAVERNARDSTPAQVKGSGWMWRLKGGFGKSASAAKESTDDAHHQQAALPPPPPPPTEADNNEHLRQQLEQAKSNLKLASEILNNPHLVYKWLNDHPDSKLDAEEIFDIIDIR